MTYLHFAYDGTGALMWLEKISVVATFSRGCSSVAGEATYAIYPAGLDPFETPGVRRKRDARDEAHAHGLRRARRHGRLSPSWAGRS